MALGAIGDDDAGRAGRSSKNLIVTERPIVPREPRVFSGGRAFQIRLRTLSRPPVLNAFRSFLACFRPERVVIAHSRPERVRRPRRPQHSQCSEDKNRPRLHHLVPEVGGERYGLKREMAGPAVTALCRTHRAAAMIFPALTAAIRADSSIRGPRDMLIRMAPCFIRAMSSAPMMPRLRGDRAPRRSDLLTRRAPASSAFSSVKFGRSYRAQWRSGLRACQDDRDRRCRASCRRAPCRLARHVGSPRLASSYRRSGWPGRQR